MTGQSDSHPAGGDDVPAEEVVRSCRAVLGDELRSVVHFTGEGHQRLYLREDLSAEADLDAFVANARAGFGSEWTDLDSELGAFGFTVQGFDNGYLIRIVADGEGVFATADPTTLERVRETAVAVRDVLEG